MALLPGQVLVNRYQIVELVGQGGFGGVYRAWDTSLQIPLALKVNFDSSPKAEKQFVAEAQLLARLVHPNLPRVIDHFVIPNEGQFLVMDFAEGVSLEALLERRGGPLTESEILPWIRQVCHALDYIHNQKPPIIHRDIKPANIIITDEGRAILVDFGISKRFDPNRGTTVAARAVTPGYSPPEQYSSRGTDSRSDIYALGATIYTLLTGQTPPDSVDVISGHSSLMGLQDVSADVRHAVLTAMSVFPEKRFQSAGAFANALGGEPGYLKVTSHIPVASNPPSAQARGSGCTQIIVVLLMVLVFGVVGFSIFRPSSLTGNWPFIALGGLLLFGGAVWLGTRLVTRPRRTAPSASVKAGTISKPEATMRPDTIPASESEIAPGPAVSEPMRGKTVKLNIPAMIAQRQGPVFDELILHDSYDRLKSFVNYSSGGRFVLTGYGRFGGTSLVTAMMRQGQRNLNASGVKGSALPVFYFEVREDFKNKVVQFKVTANESSVGVFRADISTSVDDPDFLQKIIHTSAMKKSLPKNKDELRRMTQLVMERAGQKGEPPRTVIVLDRIRHLETLEVLSTYDLFEGDQLSVVAVTRKEDADRWNMCKERLDEIGFQQWYVPCLWNSGNQLRDTLKRVLFASGNSGESEDDVKMLENVLKHFEYQGRGILGDTLDGIKHPDNWYADNDRAMFAVESVWKQSHAQRNCWLQDMLDLNWAFILGSLQVGSPESIDRARLGIYNLLDWITEAGDFSVAELYDKVSSGVIAIAANTRLRDRAIENLIYVLERNRFLKRNKDKAFEVAWRLDALPPLKIGRRARDWGLPGTAITTPVQVDNKSSVDVLKQQPPSEGAIVNVLTERFSKSDLDDLAIQLGIDPENIKGDNKAARARELTVYLKHRDRLSELVDAIRKMRPGKL